MDTHTPPPVDAFRFAAEVIPIREATGDSPRKFGGVAYSGQPIHGHWFWGDVVFDLSSTAAADRVPALIEHDRAQRAGFAALDISPAQITIADGVLLDNVHGQAVAAESDAGFPWQMSVHIEPGRVEEVQPGQTVTVNGHECVGPVHIFRDSTIREVSFTPTGADPHTAAHAMTWQTPRPPAPEEDPMTIEELQAQVADLTTKFSAAEQRAEQAEQQLATAHKAQRLTAVQETFAALGKKITEEEAAPYLAMDATTFAAVAKHLEATRPEPPEHLFAAQATDGADGSGANTVDLSESITKFNAIKE